MRVLPTNHSIAKPKQTRFYLGHPNEKYSKLTELFWNGKSVSLQLRIKTYSFVSWSDYRLQTINLNLFLLWQLYMTTMCWENVPPDLRCAFADTANNWMKIQIIVLWKTINVIKLVNIKHHKLVIQQNCDAFRGKFNT